MAFDRLRLGLVGFELANDLFLFRAELRQGIGLNQSCRQRLRRMLSDHSRRLNGRSRLASFKRRRSLRANDDCPFRPEFLPGGRIQATTGLLPPLSVDRPICEALRGSCLALFLDTHLLCPLDESISVRANDGFDLHSGELLHTAFLHPLEIDPIGE